MRKIILVILGMFAGSLTFAQYKPVDQGSSLQFTIQNLGFDVQGSFTGFNGAINFDAQSLAKCSFDVTIDAGTVNTGNSMRDNHLKGDSYFDVKDYPLIHFVSTKIIAGKGGAFNVLGKLTIKDKTNDISFPFSAVPSADGYLFKGSFKINRKDYGIGGTSTISNELEVVLSVSAKKG